MEVPNRLYENIQTFKTPKPNRLEKNQTTFKHLSLGKINPMKNKINTMKNHQNKMKQGQNSMKNTPSTMNKIKWKKWENTLGETISQNKWNGNGRKQWERREKTGEKEPYYFTLLEKTYRRHVKRTIDETQTRTLMGREMNKSGLKKCNCNREDLGRGRTIESFFEWGWGKWGVKGRNVLWVWEFKNEGKGL